MGVPGFNREFCKSIGIILLTIKRLLLLLLDFNKINREFCKSIDIILLTIKRLLLLLLDFNKVQ